MIFIQSNYNEIKIESCFYYNDKNVFLLHLILFVLCAPLEIYFLSLN